MTHIQQTPFIHYTGTFLAWHRYYVWVYEQALRTECGYTGSIPYWSWPQYVNAPQDSPIFNGDEFSMGGNGEFIPGRPDTILNPPPGAPGDPIMVPPGLGGGCVKTGPFKDMEVNLGPIALPGEAGTGPNGGLGYNPRCLKRDVGPAVAQAFTNASAVLRKPHPLPIGTLREISLTVWIFRRHATARHCKLPIGSPRSSWDWQPSTSWRRALHDQVSLNLFLARSSLTNTVAILAEISSQVLEIQHSSCITDRLIVCGQNGRHLTRIAAKMRSRGQAPCLTTLLLLTPLSTL